MSARTFIPGTAVRLSFDTGPKSVGYVVEVIDDVRLRLEFPSATGTHDGEFFEGRASVFVQPVSVLVPVCEWVESHPDEYGLACSEPGVPTVIDIPCHYDAVNTVWPRDPQSPDEPPVPMNMCPTHTSESLLEALALGLGRLDTEPVTHTA